MTSVCRSCGQIAEGDPDFCPNCGEYLRWDPTGFQKAVEPAAPPAPPAPGAAPPAAPPPAPPAAGAPPPPAPPQAPAPAPVAPDAVLIALRRPDDEGYASERISLGVAPGGAVVLMALIRNQSGIVNNYDVSVDGLPEEWWSVAPATVYLVPFGAAGGSYEQEVEIRLAPPRTAEAEARDWEIAVVATSRAHGAQVRSASTTLAIGAFSELESELTPERRSGRLEATFSLALTNRANAPVDVQLAGVNPEQSLGFVFREPYVPRAHRKRDPLDEAGRGYRKAEGLARGDLDVERMGEQALRRATSGAEGKVVRFLRSRKKVGREIRGPLRIAPGERAEATVGVSPPKQIWIGRGVLHPFQVTVQPVGMDGQGPPASGTFRQRQWLPWWLMIVVPLLIIGGIWLLSQRTTSHTVPDLSTAPDVFAAKALLDKSGFTLGETFQEQSATAKEGAIIQQDPAAGQSAAEGTAVSIKVAVGAEKKAVPDLTGQTADQAKATLTAAGFQLGRPLNAAADPATATIANQIPVPDSLEASGAAVDVVFNETATGASTAPATAPVTAPPPATAPGTPPPATTPAPATTAPAASAPAAPAAPATPRAPIPLPTPAGMPPVTPSAPTPGGGVKVPSLTGSTQAQAADALAKLGLVPGIVSATSATVPAGSVAAQQPAAGSEVAAGATIAITISRGYPAVIHDENGDIVRVGGAAGQPVEQLAASEDVEEQPNASFATPLIAYRRGPEGSTKGVAPSAQIWVVDPSDPRSARPLTNEGFDDRRPAISPDGKVVAFVSNRGSRPDDYDLCFARIDQSQQTPKCIADRDVNVSRPAWSPDGRSIVVTASDGSQTELLLLTSVVPSSGVPSDWTPQGLVTDGMHSKDRKTDQVLSSAFSPDGTKLAFSANWRSNTFTLWLVDVKNGVIGTEAQQQPFIAACELAWRPDGGELAIAQRNSTCDERGRIVRVDPATPNNQTLLSRLDAASGNPVWAPPAPG